MSCRKFVMLSILQLKTINSKHRSNMLHRMKDTYPGIPTVPRAKEWGKEPRSGSLNTVGWLVINEGPPDLLTSSPLGSPTIILQENSREDVKK